jgi:hypothetical protein
LAGRRETEDADEKRATDPFCPGDIPEDEPFTKAGRSRTAVLAVGLVVAPVAGLAAWAILREIRVPQQRELFLCPAGPGRGLSVGHVQAARSANFA